MDVGTDSYISISESGCAIEVEGVQIELGDPRRGWLRRFHRADWGIGVETGSVEALELGTWHTAYSWMIDSAFVDWVTAPNALRRAESKLVQWAEARALGIRYPRTLVTTNHHAVAAAFSDEVVIKPLGTGQYILDGEVKTVYVEPMKPDDVRLHALSLAPFIVQECLKATRHLRVVTVGDRVWVAALDVRLGDPADWRQVSANHSNFRVIGDASPEVLSGALSIALRLGLGYSSQDWIQTRDGDTYLVDVNPAGQWLFLPEIVGYAIADAIADQLLEIP